MIDKKPEITQRAQAESWQALASEALPISLPTGGLFQWDANKELKAENGGLPSTANLGAPISSTQQAAEAVNQLAEREKKNG